MRLRRVEVGSPGWAWGKVELQTGCEIIRYLLLAAHLGYITPFEFAHGDYRETAHDGGT